MAANQKELPAKVVAATPASLKEHASRRRAEESRLPKLYGPTQASEEHLRPHSLLQDLQVIRELAPHVQDRFGISETWHLLFWSALHGTSLHHLYAARPAPGRACCSCATAAGAVGALCSELREVSTARPGESHFYGDGQCCCLRCRALVATAW